MTRTRVFAATAGASVLLALIGFGWDAARFGYDADVRVRLQQELSRRVGEHARAVEVTAVRASHNADLVAAATTSRDRLPELFAHLSDPLAADLGDVSATIWVPTTASPDADYRALAWTDGPAEDLTAVELARAPALFVAQGAAGLRLVYVAPIERGGARIGVTAAETPLSVPTALSTVTTGFVMDSTVGPIAIEAAGSPVDPATGQFVIASPAGVPLLTGRVDARQAADSRRVFRWRVIAIAAAPWAAPLVMLLVTAADRRRVAVSRTAILLWTLLMAAVVTLTALVTMWLLRRSGLDETWSHLAGSVAALGLAAVGPAAAWRYMRPIRRPRLSSPLFYVEQLAGGAVLAAAFAALDWLCRHPPMPAAAEATHLSVIPSSLSSALDMASLLMLEIAVAWTAASVLGVLAARWTLTWRRAAFWAAALLWLAPGAVLMANRIGFAADWPPRSTAMFAAAVVVFGLAANAVRRQYRHTSEARRLVLLFCALLAPVLAVYPLTAASADRATRRIIETDYGPATQAAQQPDALRSILTTAWADIDAITDLPDLLREAGTSVSGSQLAFRIWNRTVLSRDRVSSQIELYGPGPSRALVSRFSLNVPEFGALPQASEQTWDGTGCEWDAFGEVARFGASERRMLHAERGLCGAGGEFLGAVVVRIIPDYRTLPFVTSANPYYDALGSGDPRQRDSRVSELQLVVYGWSRQPQFASGRVIWPIDDVLEGKLRRSRDNFWADRVVEDRDYHVYFLNDRGGIYGVGYPSPTPLQHATRLAESAALLMMVFVLYLAVTVILAPLLHRRGTPLGRLVKEVRASFYRKLFLFFVVAAVGPVVLFAIAFGTYMTAKLRADVESEASSVVLMARRVLDELTAAQTPTGQARPSPDDNSMIWIRQVVDQDVNLFEGPGLRATSQRDLFDSGLLPTRTPASVYRKIALDRRPVFVAEDRIGTFRYLVAAAPVFGFARETFLTVPLASRQRDIERQIDELTQGVLTGAVFLVLFAAALGASVAARVSDPVARLTRATRLVAAGRFDERLATDTADELGRLVADFNTMTQMLAAQRAELARVNQLKAWAEMARQVAHEIKNPLTPIQLAAEHLQRVHEDAHRPLGPVVDQCLTTVLKQVRLLRQIASEFSTFAGAPTPRFESISVASVVARVIEPYQAALPVDVQIDMDVSPDLPAVRGDVTLVARALTNLVENAIQAMPNGGKLQIDARAKGDRVQIQVIDTGVGMDEVNVSRAFEPYFSTKTAGSGLGLANAKRNIELCGGTVTLASEPGRGTTITVELPVDRPAVRAPA